MVAVVVEAVDGVVQLWPGKDDMGAQNLLPQVWPPLAGQVRWASVKDKMTSLSASGIGRRWLSA